MGRANRDWRPTADQLRRVREGLGWTQATMADRLAVSLRSYVRQENGQVAMTKRAAIEMVRELAKRVGVDLTT